MAGSNDFTINIGAAWKGAGAVGSAKKDILSIAAATDDQAKKWSQYVSQAIDARRKMAEAERLMASGKGGSDTQLQWLENRQRLVEATRQYVGIEKQVAETVKATEQTAKAAAAADRQRVAETRSWANAADKAAAKERALAASVVSASAAMLRSGSVSNSAAMQYMKFAEAAERAKAKMIEAQRGYGGQSSQRGLASARQEYIQAIDGMKRLESQSMSLGQKLKGAFSSAAPYLAIAYGVKKIADEIVRLAKVTYDLAKQGAAVSQVKDSFDLLNKSMIQIPDLLQRMREASKGTIDDVTLMSNIFTLVGGASPKLTRELANVAPQLLEIAKAASKLNPALGDTTFMYESLARGIKRSEFRLIDNLNLNVRVGEANKKYADALGKTVEELTAEERQLALLNEVLRTGGNLIAQAGNNTDSAVDSYVRMEATSKNLGNELKEAIHLVLQSTGIVDASATGMQNLADKTAAANEKTKQWVGTQEEIVRLKGFSQGFGDDVDTIEKNTARLEEAAGLWANWEEFRGLMFSKSLGGRIVQDTEALERMTRVTRELVIHGLAPTTTAAVDLAIQLERMSVIDPVGFEMLIQDSKDLSEIFGITTLAAEETSTSLDDTDESASDLAESTSDLSHGYRSLRDEMTLIARMKANKQWEETAAATKKRVDELKTAVIELKRELEAKTGDFFTAALDDDLLRAAKLQGLNYTYGPSSEDERLKAEIAMAEAAKSAQDYADAQKALAENTDPTQQAELTLKVLEAKKAMNEAEAAARLMNGAITEGGSGVYDFTKQLRDGLMQQLYESADAAGVGAAGLAALQGVMGKLDEDAINAAIQLAYVKSQIDLLGPAMARAIEAGMDPQEAAAQAKTIVDTLVKTFSEHPAELPIKPVIVGRGTTRGGAGTDSELDSILSEPIEEAKTQVFNLADFMDDQLAENIRKIELDYNDVLEAYDGAQGLRGELEKMALGYTVKVRVDYETSGSPGGGGWGGNSWPGHDDTPEYAHGSGGLVDFGAGTPAVLHGREAVLTESQLNNLIGNLSSARHNAGGPTASIVVHNHNKKAAAVSVAMIRNVLRGRMSSYMGGA